MSSLVVNRHLDQGCPLEGLVLAADEKLRSGERVQVVFDLDDTLFLVKPRKQAILRELAAEFFAGTNVAQALSRLAASHIPYDLREALGTVGIAERHHENIQELFFQRFFDGGYIKHDALNEGATDYVNQLHQLGAHIVYLSGRPDTMLQATIDMLEQHRLPLHPSRTEVVLKRPHEMSVSDVAFKAEKAELLARGRICLGVFDNEPANLNAMSNAFSSASFFLLDTDHSPAPPPLAVDAHVVRDFRFTRARLNAALQRSKPLDMAGVTLTVSLDGGK
ncbi:MAG: HAD family hydrolase [Candidatus Sericytochromatia bacterium]|nr:HAD family hydrolase [Candidatus Sericytochromatia bacterium]